MKLNMEQSCQNENRISNEYGCEIIMDDILEEEKTRKPSKSHDNLQTKANVNSEKNIKWWKIILKNCMFKEISGKAIIEIQYVGHFIV